MLNHTSGIRSYKKISDENKQSVSILTITIYVQEIFSLGPRFNTSNMCVHKPKSYDSCFKLISEGVLWVL